jgi:predicted RNA-binding protein with TRAM domain
MTRQNVTDGPREVMTKKCPTCGGDGIVVSEHTAAVDIERRLRSLVTPGSRDKAFKVEVAAKVANLVVGPGGSRLRELEETTKRRFFLAGKEGEHLDHFRVLDQGTLEKVAPKLPFDVGAEIEVKLGEIDKYDAHAGAGKVEDVDVIVGDAAKLIGKKVKVRVTAVTEGTAWAELLTPVEPADEPLTAEAEAEKPTRVKRSSSRKKSDDTEVVEGEVLEDEDSELEDEDEVEVDDELDDAVADAPAEGDAPADGDAPATPKKRTRRGSRGGRNRKKKTATATGTGGAIAAASTNGGEVQAAPDAVAEHDASVESREPEQADEPGGPVIHVPGRDLGTEDGDTPAPVKKKTRRGSRGGKNRKKKTAAATGVGVALATADAVADPPAEADLEAPVEEAAAPEAPIEEPAAEEATPEPKPEEPSQNGDGDWGYTPMSQWGIDE